MLNQDNQNYFQYIVFQWLKEFIQKQPDQDSANVIWNTVQNIPNDFWDDKYKILQSVIKVINNKKELLNLLLNYQDNVFRFYRFLKKTTDFHIGSIFEEIQNSLINDNLSQINDENLFHVYKSILLANKLSAVIVADEIIGLSDFYDKRTSVVMNSQITSFIGSSKPHSIHKGKPESLLPKNTSVLAAMPIEASVKSHFNLDNWKENLKGYGGYEMSGKNNPHNRVEVLIGGEDSSDILALEAARQVIDLMGIDAAKIQLVFASHLIKHRNPCQAKFTLKCTDIIKQIGWDKKHRCSAQEKLTKVASIVFYLGRMLIQSTWVEGKPKGKKNDVSLSISPLWVIEIEAKGQKNIFTGEVDAPDEVYVTVSPGLWAEKWLNKTGIKAGIALNQFGWLATKILTIDPYHDELALKLAIHLTMMNRINMQNKNQYEYRVGTLLEAVELEAKINKAREDCRKAYTLKQQWDNALILLMNMEWQIVFNDTTAYPEWLRPNSQAEKPSDYKTEKIIDRLWKAKLTIMPPVPIPCLLATKEKPKLNPTKPSLRGLTPDQIRNARKDKKWTQRKTAGWLGISQSMLALIEHGQRPINPELEAKLRKFLEI